MTLISFLIITIIILLILLFWNFLLSNPHITRIVIEADYDKVWRYFSEPEHYAELFPNWIVKISKDKNGNYQALQKHVDEAVAIQIEKNKAFGFIKLHIGEAERSQIRIIPLTNSKTLALNIGFRWKDFPYPFWLAFKRNTNKDYKNAKQVIETRSVSSKVTTARQGGNQVNE